MKKYEIVKENKDFDDIIKNGKYLKSKYYSIYYKENNLGLAKFGIAVSKKFGNAVERNKVKRQLRSLIDQYKKMFSKSNYYIIMVRVGVKNVCYSMMEQDFVSLLQKGFEDEKN